MSNPFKEQLAETVSVNKEQKRKEEEATIKLLSLFQKGKELTEEDKDEVLKIDKEILPKGMYRMIYSIVETTIKTGTVPALEDFVKEKQKRKKVSLRALEFLGQREEEELKKGKEMRQDEKEI